MRPYKMLGAVGALILADQAIKILVKRFLEPVGMIELLPFLSLTYVENPGVSFGLMQDAGNKWLLIVNLAATAAIYVYWRRRMRAGTFHVLETWGLALILAGALGNIFDRLHYGYVVDFVDFKVWPVFNLADSLISIGVGCYLASSLSAWKRSRARV
ncbi:MAG: signal peptidase II [Elusimicrobia bacterium]|nr:signal peptidase II [Elusimicrobiota bacterium]